MTLSAFRDFLFGPLRPMAICSESATITPAEMLGHSLRQCQSPKSYFNALALLNRQRAIPLSVDLQRMMADLGRLHDSEVLGTAAIWAEPLPHSSANEEFYGQLFRNFAEGYFALLSKAVNQSNTPELQYLYLYEFYDEANSLLHPLEEKCTEEGNLLAQQALYTLVNLYNEVSRLLNPANSMLIDGYRSSNTLLVNLQKVNCPGLGSDQAMANLVAYLNVCNNTLPTLPAEPAEERYFYIDKTCKILNIARASLYNYINEGLITKYSKGRRPCFKESEILKLKESKQV